MFQKQQHEIGRMKDLRTTLHTITKGTITKGPYHYQRSFVVISHLIISQKGSIIIHSLHFLLCLVRLAEVDQVQGTFINIATFKNCKNVNGKYNETTLRTSIKMSWNIVIAFVRLILISISLKQHRGDISWTLKNRNHESECNQKICGEEADRFYVYGVWLTD